MAHWKEQTQRCPDSWLGKAEACLNKTSPTSEPNIAIELRAPLSIISALPMGLLSIIVLEEGSP